MRCASMPAMTLTASRRHSTRCLATPPASPPLVPPPLPSARSASTGRTENRSCWTYVGSPSETDRTMHGTVEIRVPTFRRPELLRRALASVIGQTYPDWRCIVLDDSPHGAEADN